MYFHLHNYMNCLTVKRKQCVQLNTLMRGIGKVSEHKLFTFQIDFWQCARFLEKRTTMPRLRKRLLALLAGHRYDGNSAHV